MSKELLNKVSAAGVAVIASAGMMMPSMAFAANENENADDANVEKTTNTATGDEEGAGADEGNENVEPGTGGEGGEADEMPATFTKNDDGTYSANFFKTLTVAGTEVAPEEANGSYLRFDQSVIDVHEGYVTFTFFGNDIDADEVEYTFDDTLWTQVGDPVTTTDEDTAGATHKMVSTQYTGECADGETFTLTVNEEYYVRDNWTVNVIDPSTDETVATYDVSKSNGEIPNVIENAKAYYLDAEMTKPLETLNFLDYAPEDKTAALDIYVEYAEDAAAADTVADETDTPKLAQTGDAIAIGAGITAAVAAITGAVVALRRRFRG